jgi:glycosyltransferase involved in cell wall biosynthesis
LDFVRVVAKLKRDYPALKAVICGVGPLRAEVLALARKMGVGECLLLPGAVDDVPVVMRAASLLLHVSEAETEGLPNVILEAQAVGLPIVCTKSGGIAECLLPRWAALMRKTGDVAGLTKTCREVLKEGVAYRKYARGERKKVLKRHSIAKLTQTTLRVAGVVTDD